MGDEKRQLPISILHYCHRSKYPKEGIRLHRRTATFGANILYMNAKLMLLAAVSFFSLMLQAQTLQLYPVAATGCKAGYYCTPGEFQAMNLPDSSVLYVAECKGGDEADYGVVCIKLHHPEASAAAAETAMQQHLVMLKTAFGADINVSKERKTGITMPANSKVKGVLDVFENEESRVYRTKSWTNGKFVAILYVRKIGDWNTTPEVEAFLNGFQFPSE